MDKVTKIVLAVALLALLLMFISLGHDVFTMVSKGQSHAQSASTSQVQSAK